MIELFSTPVQLGLAGQQVETTTLVLASLRMGGTVSPFALGWEMATKSPAGPVRDAYLQCWQKVTKTLLVDTYVDFTAERLRKLSAVAIPQILSSDDPAIGVGLALLVTIASAYSPHADDNWFHNDELISALVILWDRFLPASLSEQWWSERCEVMDCAVTYAAGFSLAGTMCAIALRGLGKAVPKAMEPHWHSYLDRCTYFTTLVVILVL